MTTIDMKKVKDAHDDDGTRVGKYQPIIDALDRLAIDEMLTVKLSSGTSSMGIRTTIHRHYGAGQWSISDNGVLLLIRRGTGKPRMMRARRKNVDATVPWTLEARRR